MTKEHKLYELTKQLVYQMTGEYTEDVQNSDFQIAWHYLSEAMDFIESDKVADGTFIPHDVPLPKERKPISTHTNSPKPFKVKDLKCPMCKQHSFITLFGKKECSSCGHTKLD